VIRSGVPLPRDQTELDKLVAAAQTRCKTKSGLSLGFRNFSRIFISQDGWTTHASIDGAYDSSRAYSEASQSGRSIADEVEDEARSSPSPSAAETVVTCASSQTKRKVTDEYVERMARRTRQAQDNSLRMERTLVTMDGTTNRLVGGLNDVVSCMENGVFYMADVYSKFSQEMRMMRAEQAPDYDQLRQVHRHLAERLIEVVNTANKRP
jgi:hypothetical protein